MSRTIATTDDTAGAHFGRALVLVLFFASGLSALIYQVIWLRKLATIFGSTTFATTTVLAAFMGGLALGSWLFGGRADRLARPLYLYGALEIGIGLFALAFPVLINAVDGLYIVLHRQVELSFYGLSLVRFLVCSLILIVPTAMMGGTFPLMNRYYIRRYSTMTSNVSLVYGVNTLGAVFGVVLAGFVLMEAIGIHRTSLIAVGINVTVGVIAVILGRRAAPPQAAETTASPGRSDGLLAEVFPRRAIFVAAFLSGLAALAYEVIWTRTLVFILDSFVYSFSIMLATFLVGIALGSLIVSRVAPWIRHGYTLLAILFMLIGLTAVITMPLFAQFTLWKDAYLASISQNVSLTTPAPWGKYIAFKFLIAGLIIFPPALLMGAAFPLAIRLYSSRLDEVGRKIGAVYAINTFGSILGAFIAGFVLIPVAGLRHSLVATALVSLFTGIALILARARQPWRRRLALVAAPLAAFAVVVAFAPANIYERIFQQAQRTFDLVYFREDHTATITVHERGPRVIINLNGLNVAGTHFNFLTTQKMQAHLGLLLHPNPRRVLQIGFGSGGTAYSVSRHPSVERIDCVELCQGVIDAAKYFLPSNHAVLQNPVVHLRIEDARNYILATPNRYDLILSDSIHPAYAGNGTLYSQDYFRLCRKKLNPEGYVSFWMPTYLLSVRDYKTIIKSFQSVFPNVAIWYVSSAIEAYTIVIGRVEPFEIDLQRLQRRLAQPEVAKDLAQVEVNDVFDVLGYFMMGPERAREFAEDGDINSDDHPLIELRGPKSMTRRRTWYRNLKALAEMREPPLALLRNGPATDEGRGDFTRTLRSVYTATNYVIQGQLIDIALYKYKDEYALYEKANEVYPGDPAIERLMALTRSKILAFDAEERIKQNDRAGAVALFEQAIDVNPDPTDDTVGHAHYRLATIFLDEKDAARAQSELEQCLEVLPTHKQALLLSASLALKSSRFDLARRRIDHLRSLYPGDDDVKRLRRELPNK